MLARSFVRLLVTNACLLPPMAAAQRPDSTRLAHVVDSLAAVTLARRTTPGLAIAIVSHGSLLFTRGYGVADVAREVAVTDTTAFRIASVTKSFTAAAIMQLVEKGTLSLDDPLLKWLPDWPSDARRVTIAHLLTHTSGIQDGDNAAPTARPLRLDLARDFHDTVLAHARADTLRFAPGTSYMYSNAGYQLLGKIIEAASGQSYAAYVDEYLLRPLGLAHTYYCGSSAHRPNDARGYGSDTVVQFVEAPPINMEGPYAAGSLSSTARDVALWMQALRDGKVVSPASFVRMTTPRTFALDKPQYGFGLDLSSLDGHPIVSHDGSITGFASRVTSYSHDSLVIAVLYNSHSAAPITLERQIAAQALGLPDPAPRDLPVSAADAARVAGRYRARGYGFPLVVRYERAGLTAEVPVLGRFRLRRQGPEDYASADDHYLNFRFGGAGALANDVRMTEPGHTISLDRQVAAP